MTRILIPHGTTPTGVGLRQRTNGNLRPLSPCCGRSMEGRKAVCKGCGEEHRSLALKLGGSLGNDIPLSMVAETNEIIRCWVGDITGYGEGAIQLDVMW